MVGLTELDAVPEGLLECGTGELYTRLNGPTLIHLPGLREPPLFVSTLLHGNEPAGWEAMRSMLAAYQNRELPRAVSWFIGNVEAARAGVRYLEHQPDYNRVWPGGLITEGAEAAMMAAIVEKMRARGVFASIDIHNSTGRNPQYACITRLDYRSFQLANLFGRVVVYFTRPRGVQAAAFSALCPAVTIECGPIGDESGVVHARDYLDACLQLEEIPSRPLSGVDIDLFHTVAVVKVRAGTRFGFDGEALDLKLLPDLDQFNFRELAAGTILGEARTEELPLHAWDEEGNDRAAQYFQLRAGRLEIATTVMPAMLTRDLRAIEQDCLCYLMERMRID